MRKIKSAVVSLTTAVALAVPAFAAAPLTEITSLSATVSGTSISVSGQAVFGGEDPVTIAEDATDDGFPVNGLEITKLEISRPDPKGHNLLFTISLASLGEGIPEFVQYNWDIMVDGGAGAGGSGSNWSIKTMRQQARTGSIEPYAAIHSCAPSATGFSCSELTRIGVVYDSTANQIRLTVPMGAINALPGSTISGWARNGDPMWVRLSAAGAFTGVITFDEAIPEVDYRVPDSKVSLGIAPAGTPADTVKFTTSAGLNNAGAFTGSLTAPGAGDYEIWAKACYGANCAVSTVPVTTT